MSDLISRQDAIELAMQYCPDDDGTCSKADEDIRNLLDELEDLPSAQPEQRWIPCSKRLPDKPNVYTVTDHWGRVVRYVYNDNESSREYWKRCAKAWMPEPEPYKGGEDHETD